MFEDFRFHHIGIITNSIDCKLIYYINVEYEIKSKINDTIHKVWICFLKKNWRLFNRINWTFTKLTKV